ncbi:MAG TPA: head GIN domain-containing protein [Chloroflexota bacterium]|nr:head GIN domain-containing protein [Chloroflexota bacterium]
MRQSAAPLLPRCYPRVPSRGKVLAVVVLLAMAAGGSAGCRALPARDEDPTGSGRVVTDTRAVSGFSAIELRGVGQALVTLGAEEALSVEAEDNLLPQITTTVSGDKLVLELQAGRPTRPIVYRVTARQLAALSTLGAGDVAASGLAVPRLQTTQNGAGNIRLDGLNTQELESTLAGAGALDASGTASRLVVRVTGAGKVNGQDLAVEDAELTLSGAGKAVVRVSDTLQAKVAGTSSVEYLGNPRVESSVSGTGTVRPFSGG